MEGEEKSGCNIRFGCLGCLGTLFCTVLVGYLIIFHSSIPVKWIAGKIADTAEIDGKKVQIVGVGGSLKKGVTIKQLVIPGKEGDSTITGLAFKYKNFTKQAGNVYPIAWTLPIAL